ncbi:uncharacterized protein KIAA0408-like isoform X2 [Hypomesus transpacificus]|uniref:uncharacterized protein KIAA0408-like isoform X2 n=1 Tax=Hypomesus transpacificus TaxID=137520 RepID=UPI001F08734F|nr:uncharacterized protein KIAA0408-like isoform X2 [Hypomesus transpacificus]
MFWHEQGGENRRILLDLKSVLEEVQGEVKREEEKRSELQLHYRRDRCAWDLERAELKCQIAQLEARGSASGLVVVGGVGAEVVQGGGVGPSETLRRDREEQRQLLADTHTAAMDLRCRLDLNERGWLKERSELLERFASERREWESQLRDMQTKIDELYKEVRSRRERGGNVQDVGQRFSLHSSSTGSSLLSEPSVSDPPSSSCQSDTPQRTNHSNSNSSNSHGLAGRYGSSMTNSTANCVVRSSQVQRLDELGGVTQAEEQESVETQEVDTAELEAILKGVMGQGPERDIMDKVNVRVQAPFSRSHSKDSSYSNGKKRNTTALNTALKEIARVSEELCSYQDEIRRKAKDKRGNTEFPYLLEDGQKGGHKDSTILERDEITFDLNQLYADLRVLEEQNWITWSANTKDSWSSSSKKQKTNTTHPGQEKVAPPIPPRLTSWYLSNPTPPEPEVQTQESLALRKCHSPCVVVDRKSNSPSIVRKFEAMLQENEGKVLTEVGVASCSVPTNSNCNTGCCHNRWSCDGSRFGSSKSSTYVPVQKSLSEMNILTVGRENRLDHRLSDSPKSSESQKLVMGENSPYFLDLPSPNLPIVCINTQGSRRNITLEQKTAEFNRTLFQAEMGLGINEEDFIPAGVSVGCEPVCPTVGYEVTPRGAIVDLQPQRTEFKHQRGKPDILCVQSPGHALSSPPSHYPEVKLRIPSLDSRHQEGEVMEFTFDSLTSNVVSHDSNAVMSNIPSRITRHRETEPVNLKAYCVSASPKQSKAQLGERPHQANAGSTAQPLPETLPTQAGHKAQADTPRPGRRILNDHPWKPLTLASYPRPADSRSNYGAVEKILKSYESAAWAQQYQQRQPSLIQGPQPGFSQGESDRIELMDIREMDHLSLKPAPRKTQTQTTTRRETLSVQESQETSSSESVQKTFSRPARPANRRLPSRWASHSPSPSSSPSPSTTPVTQSTVSAQKHTFSYSAYHTETDLT